MTVTDHRSTGPTDVDGGPGGDAWAVLLPAGRHDAERLVHHDTLELAVPAGGPAPRPGDRVAVLADGPPRLVALGRVARNDGRALLVTYTRRSFDAPVPAGQVAVAGPVTPLDPGTYRDLVDRLGPPPSRRTWLVSLDLPIEAESRAEAVRLFWSYVQELGPAELPAFVSPSGDELAMQAFVLGVEANQDPEEDD
ncbi:hypothetical protein [Micromonospora wenchangensis]|uniref:Uncharacterized protein n=1 Tax=Micromonospora wenchangensis TaxID=1185415 RepID=A0A246RG13_9ACTN|nr:hypothetical protein [Micromonospora wenchangensis]OWU99980.1 hypothetical protein B5D80_28515 [Micromonospora wenchangensis]